MGKVAYCLGLTSLSWGLALLAELNPIRTSMLGGGPSPFATALFHHAAPALMVVLPPAVTCAVFSVERWRHLTALLLVLFGYGVALFIQLDLFWDYGRNGGEDRPTDLLSLLMVLFACSFAGAIAAAFAALPLAPILSFTRDGESDDHDARARLKVGGALAAASVFHFMVALLVASTEATTEIWEAPYNGLAVAPALGALAFGLVEIVRSRCLIASLRAWLQRVRDGEVHGLRIREKEEADASLYLPAIISSATFTLEEPEVLEAYADFSDAGPYRMKRTSCPLALVVRA